MPSPPAIRPRTATEATTMATTWRGAMPTALRMATSRTFSRVVRTTVLKTPATAMAVNTRAGDHAVEQEEGCILVRVLGGAHVEPIGRFTAQGLEQPAGIGTRIDARANLDFVVAGLDGRIGGSQGRPIAA